MGKQKSELNRPGRPNGGRPTKEQQFQKAIAEKNSAALEEHLTRIRLELFDLVANQSVVVTTAAARAKVR